MAARNSISKILAVFFSAALSRGVIRARCNSTVGGRASLKIRPRSTRYIDEKYGVEEAEKKYAEWDKLMQQLFIRRK